MNLVEDVEEMKREIHEVQQHSFAFELLRDQKAIYLRTNKRMFIIILVILGMWFATIGYLVFVLNDVGIETITQEVTQENSNGNNNFIGNDGDITNGKAEN